MNRIVIALLVSIASVSLYAHNKKSESDKEHYAMPADEHDSDMHTTKRAKKIPGLPVDAELIDGIKAVIYSEEGVDIITESDVQRPTIEGSFRSFEDILFERLVYLDAQRFKIVPDEEALDKQLKSVQRENNITLDQLKNIFKSAGYTWEEGREQYKVMLTVGYMIEHKIRSRLLVPEKDVMAYYEAHPEIEPATYLLERAFIPFSAGASKRILRSDLEEFASGERRIEGIAWSDPFWVSVDDLADDKRFITEMKPGQISMPIESAKGFELLSLKEARPERIVPLELRYRDIANILRKPRLDSLMNEYKKQLFDTASILYFS